MRRGFSDPPPRSPSLIYKGGGSRGRVRPSQSCQIDNWILDIVCNLKVVICDLTMKRFKKVLYINLLFMVLISQSLAQDSRPLIEVNSSVDTSRITIGDRITYTLSINHVDTMRVEKPGEGVNLGQFEIKDYKIYDPVRQEGRIEEKFEYVISVFDTGTFVIPPFPVAYFPTDSLGDYKLMEASPITIYVESVIQDEERQLKDVKPPIDIPYDYFSLFSVIAAVVLIGTMVFLGYRLYRKRKETGYLIKPPEPPRPAHEIALAALDELLKKDLLSEGLVKEFYIEISDIIRHYIEGRFFIRALEETSREILNELAAQELDISLKEKAKEILELSDLVKFAKYKTDTEENQKIVSLSREFIEETMVVYEEEEPGDTEDYSEINDLETEKETTEKQNSEEKK
jgi:hypothetical protein